MAAGYIELYMEQGASFSTTITIADVYGGIFDLTNFTAYSQLKKSYYSSTIIGNFLSVINHVNGTIQLSMPASDTLNIKPGRYVYDVIIRNNSDNTITRVLEGIVNVSPTVTRL